jgi:geranylgeranyl diphosphate synthase type II
MEDGPIEQLSESPGFDPAEVERELAETVAQVNAALPGFLPEVPEQLNALREACLYSLMAGGKRMRPLLVIYACEAAGGDRAAAMPIACAYEFLHTYSLIHDDLPAMDDDTLRRGRPTCHVQFDEGTAILAGDTLLTHAFGLLAEHAPTDALARALVVDLVRAAGLGGMAGGQAVDLAHNDAGPDEQLLRFIHQRKTGELLAAAVRAGAMIGAGADATAAIARFDAYGRAIGLAFQIIDDILDVTRTSEQLGKSAGKDVAQHKLTYPAVYGLDRSREIAREVTAEALAALEPLGAGADRLRRIARYLLHRIH